MSVAAHRERELRNWFLLTHVEQQDAVRRLAHSGMTDYCIAAATALAVEQVRALLGPREAAA